MNTVCHAFSVVVQSDATSESDSGFVVCTLDMVDMQGLNPHKAPTRIAHCIRPCNPTQKFNVQKGVQPFAEKLWKLHQNLKSRHTLVLRTQYFCTVAGMHRKITYLAG